MIDLLRQLTETFGPSGAEGAVRAVVLQNVRPLAGSVRVDALGNLIALKGTRAKGGQRLMLAAHMDEIGLVVSHIDEQGFARFQPLGGATPLSCLGGRVRFAGGALGVIGLETRRDDLHRVPAWSDLFIDVGAASRAECPLRVGDVGGFYRPLEEIGGRRLVGKALDDRVGVAILIETLRRLKRTPHEVAFVFTVQEEVGLRGAGAAAYGLEADLGLAVDVTRCGDTPNGPRMEVRLGGGPAVKVRDQGMIADPRVRGLLIQRAEAAKIPYQREVLELGSTDATPMQIARGGMPAGCVSIPLRYIHTPSEMVDLGDVEGAVRLLLEVLQKPVELDSR